MGSMSLRSERKDEEELSERVQRLEELAKMILK